MKATFVLEEPIGGLGNQLFQVASLLSITKDLSANLMLPIWIQSAWGSVTSPTYWTTIFRNVYSILQPPSQTNLVKYEMVNTGKQFYYQDFSQHKDTDDCVVIRGLLMNKNYFLHNLEYIRKFIHPDSSVQYTLDTDEYVNVCVGVRRNTYEKNTQHAFPTQYFIDALDTFLAKYSIQPSDKPLRFAIFTDDAEWSTEFIKDYLRSRNMPNEYIVFKGDRDGITDVQHFHEMFFCKHFVLSHSTFHYWPALLCEKEDTIIVYNPRGYYKDIVQPNWISVDF